MSAVLARQSAVYLIVGGVQLAVDWLLFSVLFWATGNASWTNLIARGGTAFVGYQLHGRVTFAAGGEPALGKQRLLRYVALLVVMVSASTIVMTVIASYAPAKYVYIAKPAIELLLAAVSFVVSRQWVFR